MTYQFAGKPLSERHRPLEQGVGKAQPLLLEDQRDYLPFHGHYVPYYAPDENEKTDRDLLAVDLARRFFENAELGINIRCDYEQMAWLKADYGMAPDGTEEKCARGALCVGAIVARMEKLAHWIIAHGKDAPALDNPAPIAKDELSEHYEYLLKNKALVSCVKRRDGSTDIDDVIYEMISEIGKAPGISLTMIYQGRAEKIGKCMHYMHTLLVLCSEIIRNEPLLERSDLHGNFERFVHTASRRVGIRSDDFTEYKDAETTCNIAQIGLHQSIRNAGSADFGGANSVAKKIDLLHLAMNLIADMAYIRYPREQSMAYFKELCGEDIT